MSMISSIFGCAPPVLTKPFSTGANPYVTGAGVGLLKIECSSRPQKKATAHHRKTRPRKTQAWDIKRKLAVYPTMPQLPPEWSLVSSAADDVTVDTEIAADDVASTTIG